MAVEAGGATPGWIPFRWFSRIKSDQPLIQAPPLIVNLPCEVRVSIWKFLNERDRKCLKQVCSLFKFDLNNNIGVNAVLTGRKCWTQLSLKSRAQSLLFGGQEIQRIEENVDWIRNVLPRNLVLREFSGVQCDTRELVSNPFMLRTLCIELDQRDRKCTQERVKEILQRYNSLKCLTLKCKLADLKSAEFPMFNSFSIAIAQDLLNSLEYKRNLTELSVIVINESKIDPFVGHLFGAIDYYSTRIVGSLPDVPTEQKAWLQSPVKLKKMHIHLPTIPVNQLREWKKFLDGQDRLSHLQVNFGHVHWNFFSTVLENCAFSLETLDLVLINWYRDNLPVNAAVTEDQWFNWRMIAPAAQKLKSLRISTVCGDIGFLRHMRNVSPAWPHDTCNFQLLTLLLALEDLTLIGIYLSGLQVEAIFNDFKNLKNVELTGWTKTGEATLADQFNLFSNPEAEDYTERNQNLCNLLKQVLSVDQFLAIKLSDKSLVFCSKEIREEFLKQPDDSVYSVTWKPAKLTEERMVYYRFPLVIKHK